MSFPPPPPGVTPNPASVFASSMSPAVSLPGRPNGQSSHHHKQQQQQHLENEKKQEQTGLSPDQQVLLRGLLFKLPKLRLEIRDLSHPAAKRYLGAVNTSDCAALAVRNVLSLLYHSPSCPTTTLPTTRSVTLILRDMGGVAFTKGSELDNDHKEIHFSLGYLARQPEDRIAAEIAGVLTHEMVHCFQYNGFGTCPGGLIEGIADWVRLRCHLSPPHWKREHEGKWDGGYQHTAYFLDYLESRFGSGTVQRLNEKLRIQKYEEKAFWTELLGRSVEQLWGDYCDKLKDEGAVVVNKEDIPRAGGETNCRTDG